jgi:formate/nitrite transporter FocA (FNT family)
MPPSKAGAGRGGEGGTNPEPGFAGGPARTTAPAREIQNIDGVTEHEIDDIEDHARLRTPVIYEIVRREGELEMDRPITSLWWSGLAAGLSISFSPFAQAIIYTHLPNVVWRPLVSAFGYSVGFLMVVLARQQLFTENTLTVVLPLMAKFNATNVQRLIRMWSVVLAANLVGTLCAALICRYSPVLAPGVLDGMLDLGGQLMDNNWAAMFFKGIAAGFLVAMMVWLIPSAEGAKFQVVTMSTYLIAAGGFTHIIAGSFEGFLLVLSGQLGLWHMFTHFTVPVLLGNVIGGTLLFAVLSYAQVMEEMRK